MGKEILDEAHARRIPSRAVNEGTKLFEARERKDILCGACKYGLQRRICGAMHGEDVLEGGLIEIWGLQHGTGSLRNEEKSLMGKGIQLNSPSRAASVNSEDSLHMGRKDTVPISWGCVSGLVSYID